VRWQTAGLPIGSKIIQMNGVAVSSKAEIMAQLSTAGNGPIAFTFMQPIAMAETVVQATLVEAPSPAPAPRLGSYTCCKKSQIRTGFEMDSDKAGVLTKGESIDALEERVNDDGITRVRFEKGWVSKHIASGEVVLVRAPASINAADINAAALMDPDGFGDALDHDPDDEDLDKAIAQAADGFL
jgi:hypothetical protein